MQTFDEFGREPDRLAGGRFTMDRGLGWMDNECGIGNVSLEGSQKVKLAGFFGCLFLVAPLGLAAQNASSSYGVFRVAGSQTTTLIGPDGKPIPATRTFPQPNMCPVSIQASHLSDGNVVNTGAGLPRFYSPNPKGVGQLLHFNLRSPDQRTIASATVNLRGWTAKGRTAKVDSSGDASLPVRTLTILFAPNADRTVKADVWAPGLTAVVSVELLYVQYADGSAWTPEQGHVCRVVPDHMMLIIQ
jgi:hypothetical protein